MKHDPNNSDFVTYAKAVQGADRAFYARLDGKHMYDPEYLLRQELAEDAADEARRLYVRTNPPGIHTHSIYLCFDNWPLEHHAKTRFHDDPVDHDNDPDWVDLCAFADYYSPDFPNMSFDCHGEDGTIYGTQRDCEALAAVSELDVDVDVMDPDDMGAINWPMAYELLGEPVPKHIKHFADTVTTLKHFKGLCLRLDDDQGGEQLQRKWDEHFRNVCFHLIRNCTVKHAEFLRWVNAYFDRTACIDEGLDMLNTYIDAAISLQEAE